jgi:hypothetical protein
LESSVDESAEGAPDDTSGADSDDRSKLRSMAAARIQDAIERLDQGDVEGARKVLVELLHSTAPRCT